MTNNIPILYIFSGLPACGKTTIAEMLSNYSGSLFLKIDTVEQGLRDLCSFNVQGEGYRLSYRIAKDNLKLGINVVADSCNPILLTREEWEGVAKSCDAYFENIEIICSDSAEHKKRVESRKSTVPNLKLPTWHDVVSREYHSWKSSHHVIDTANLGFALWFKTPLKSMEIFLSPYKVVYVLYEKISKNCDYSQIFDSILAYNKKFGKSSPEIRL